MTAKVIRIEDTDVTLGYDDGHFEMASIYDFGFQIFNNSMVEVYTNEDGKKMYTPKQTSIFGKTPNITCGTGYLVNKTTFCLLALLLGGIGVHKFYEGRILLGILYLLFCWTGIPTIVSVVEGILALTKDADFNGDIEVGF